MSQRILDAKLLIGNKFNRLELIEVLDVTSLSGQVFGFFRCDCGTEKAILFTNVISGRTKSCGCLHKEILAANQRLFTEHTARTHGMSGTPEYSAWTHMIDRCTNENCQKWADYGGRGITICEAWRTDFAAFFAYMGLRPSPRHSLDRFPNNDGNYEPGNVRWATSKEQAMNRRPKSKLTQKQP
jgi:hypothetical protein